METQCNMVVVTIMWQGALGKVLDEALRFFLVPKRAMCKYHLTERD